METNKKVFGVYENTADAQRAVEELLNMGYGSDEISVLSKDQSRLEDIEGADTATETGLKGGVATGATIGGLGGLLAGLGALAIPGIGPILAAGPLAAALTGALAGGAIGGTIGTIGGALIDAGMSEDDARYVDERFHEGSIIVYVDTDEARFNDVSRTLNYSDRGGSYDPIVPTGVPSVEMNEADPENYSGRSFAEEPILDVMDESDPVRPGNSPLGSFDPISTPSFDPNVEREFIAGSLKPDPVEPVYEPVNPYHDDLDRGEGLGVQDNLTEHDQFKEEVVSGEPDRSYNSVMAGAGRVNPVDPTMSTGYTGEEPKPYMEETVMNNNDKSRYDADNLDRKNDNPLEKAKDWVSDKVEDVKDTFDNNDRGEVKDSFDNVGNKIQDTGDNVKHDVQKNAEKLERRVDNAGEPLEDAQNWVGDKASDVKHETGKVVDKIKNRTDD